MKSFELNPKPPKPAKPTPTHPPRITDPMGRYWQQPPRENVLLDGMHALMSRRSFETLLDYTGSRPTGAYTGKMWRAMFRGKWFLMWYEPDVLNADALCTQFRELLIAE